MSAVAATHARARNRSIGTALKLTAVVAVATAVLAAIGTRGPSPWIVPDELIYSELAKSIAAGHLPAIRGVTTLSYGLGYPLLIAPAWLFHSTTVAYTAARLINALLMALAALPAYFLARRFVAPRNALLVACLAVALPSVAYSGTLLVENAFYPAFLLAALAITRALERPTISRQAGVLGTIGIAYSVKALAVALVPAYLTSVALIAVLHGRPRALRAQVRTYAPTLVILAFALVAAAGAAAVTAGTATAALGRYGVVAGHVDFLAVPWWFVLHLVELDLYAVFVPFAASALLVALVARRRLTDDRARLFVAVLAPLALWTVLIVAAYASKANAGARGFPGTSARLHERNTFFLVPLLLVGLALAIELGLHTRRRGFASSLGLAAVLPALLPVAQLRLNAHFQALALVPWYVSRAPAWLWPPVVIVAGLLAAALALTVHPSRTRTLWMFVALWFLLVTACVEGSMLSSARESRQASFGPTAAWIDQAVGASSSVAVLWEESGREGFAAPAARHRLVWVNEFFNRSVGQVYELGREMPYGLPATRVHVKDGVVVDRGGRAVRARYVLARCAVDVAARPVRVDRPHRIALYRVDGPIRLGHRHPCSDA